MTPYRGISITAPSGTVTSNTSYRIGRLAVVNLTFTLTTGTSAWSNVLLMPGTWALDQFTLSQHNSPNAGQFFYTDKNSASIYTNAAIAANQSITVYGVIVVFDAPV